MGVDIASLDLSAEERAAIRMLALTPSERLWIDAMPRAAMRLFTTVLLFSAKETLFKALYPGVRTCL